jgi:hypothetical protein
MAPGKKTLGGKNTPSRPPTVLPDHAAAMEIPGTSQPILLRVRFWGFWDLRFVIDLNPLLTAYPKKRVQLLQERRMFGLSEEINTHELADRKKLAVNQRVTLVLFGSLSLQVYLVHDLGSGLGKSFRLVMDA